MKTPPEDNGRRALQQRLAQLRNQLFEVSGGEMEYGPAGEGLTPELEVAFLEQVLAFETAPQTTWGERLRETGYAMPKPASLSDQEIGLELWQVIQRLAELRLFLASTNHLSDRELYAWLYREVLPAETISGPIDPHSACHFDVLGACSEDDTACWLRYYADEGDRREWQQFNPGEPLPPHEDPPYQRDHLLPQPTYPPETSES
jgi:hypothetical protein